MLMSPCGLRTLRDVLVASVLSWLRSLLVFLPSQEPKPVPDDQQEIDAVISQLSPQKAHLSAQGTTIPPEIEQDIVSRLALEFQGKESKGKKRAECRSMDDLLERLGNLFPENQGKNTSNDRCCICRSGAIFYPYALADCGHVACGRCIYTTGVAQCGEAMRGNCQLCGQTIRNEPKRLDNHHLYHAKSQWTLPNRDYQRLLTQHEQPVHQGRAGVFGNEEVPDSLETFEGVGYVGTFDGLPVLDITTVQPLPETCSKELRLTYCPAHCNYSGFPIASFSHLRTPSKLIPLFQAMKHLASDDVYILEEDDHQQLTERPDRFNVRLTGWEQFAKDRSIRRERKEREYIWQRN